MRTQCFQMSLYRPYIAFKTDVGQTLLQLGRGGFAVARNQAQQFDGEKSGIKIMAALAHGWF